MGQQDPRFWRRIRQRVNGFKSKFHSTEQECYMGRLPREIMDLIIDQLPVSSQACLALTCKSLFHFYGPVLKREEFTFPRLLSMYNPDRCCRDTTDPRKQLLITLEDDHWAYCSRCMRLHPRDEFSRLRLAVPARWRTCAPNAGIVDLCPCISLTFRDVMKLDRAIQNALTEEMGNSYSVPIKLAQNPWRTWHRLRKVDAGVYLEHRCAGTNNCRSLFFARTCNVEARIKGSVPLMGQVPGNCAGEPAYTCPHYGALFRKPGHKRRFPVERCRRCGTVCDDLVPFPGLRFTIEAWRGLGGTVWPPSRQWGRQCRMIRRGDYYLE